MYISKWETGWVFLLVAIIGFGAPVFLGAQSEEDEESCGFIIELSGLEDGFADCSNPFEASSEAPPYLVFFDGTLLGQDAELELETPLTTSFLVSANGEETLEAFALYRQIADNYQAIALEEQVEGEQYGVTIETPGEYFIVFNRSASDEVSFWQWPHFTATVHAQVGDEAEEGSTVYVQQFTVTGDDPVADCGFYIFDETFQEPIEDCDNPFGPEQTNSNLELRFGEVVITDEGSFPLVGETSPFSATGTVDTTDFTFLVEFELWRHDGDDRILELRAFNFDGTTENYHFTAPATYTTVITESDRPIESRGWWGRLFALLVPPAHAALDDRTVIEFTVTEDVPPPPPTGASSVLFLPGIQASRLYEVDFGFDERRWEPFGNRDVRALEMTDEGQSVNEIYTEDILDSVTGLGDIYAGFINHMDGLKSADVIDDWEPFAYDWRYAVEDVAKNGTQYNNQIISPLAEVERLAADSHTGQVTLIGHSNGGLLAKAILIELEAQGRSELIDRVVFFATPQLGTPKAIGTVLHGYDQEDKTGGLIIDDSIARSVIKNLPGAYGLIPSQAYFDATNDLIVSFDASDATAAFRSAYGNAIQDAAELQDLMIGRDGRPEPLTVNDASFANENMLAAALQSHDSLLDTWQAPAGVEVVEIVGIGLNTVSGFEYTEFTERICGEPDIFGTRECEFKTFYEPIPYISQFGDLTVMAPSAEAYPGEKITHYVDLLAIKNDQEATSVDHVNIGENEVVQELISQILVGSSTDLSFVSFDRPSYANERSMLGSHSPVSMHIVDAAGNQTGIFRTGGIYPEVKEDIPESTVFQFGSTTYIVVPKDITYQVLIEGEDEGGMTLTNHSLVGESQTLANKVSVATVTASTTISIESAEGRLSNLQVDVDGDGVVDTIITPDGETLEPTVATYKDLKTQIKAIDLKRSKERALLRTVRLAEWFGEKSQTRAYFAKLEDRTLQRLIRKIQRLEDRDQITGEETGVLVVTINQLISVR